MKEKIKRVVVNHFSRIDGPDKAFIYGEFEISDRNTVDELVGNLKIEDLDILDILLYLASEMTNNGLVEIGHGILFDAAKFIVAYSLLLDGKVEPNWLLDVAVVSYLLPQLEYFMPKLRKGKIFEEEKYTRIWDHLMQIIKDLDLRKTSTKLGEAKEEFKVLL